MADLKLLSVIIPAYNSEKYLEKCVASVAEQTYQNIEIVIVNNGSTDSTPQVCEELANKYDNREFKIVNLNPNQGINWARRAGVENADGDYIAFIDSDDYIDLTAYEKVIKVLEENDCDMVQFGYRSVDEQGKIISEHHREPVKFDNERDAFKYFVYIILINSALVWEKVYKRAIFDNIEWPKLSGHEDFCTSVQLFAKVKKFIAIDDVFYCHFDNLKSESRLMIETKSKISNIIDGAKFCSNFTEKTMPELLPEMLYFLISVNTNIISLIDNKDIINQIRSITTRDYQRMKSELKKQNRKLYIKRDHKHGIHIWFSLHYPNLYKVYLTTRLKIHALTGI